MGNVENCSFACMLFLQFLLGVIYLYTSGVKRFHIGGFYISVLLGVLRLFIPAYAEMCNNILVMFWRNCELGRSQIHCATETKDVCRKFQHQKTIQLESSYPETSCLYFRDPNSVTFLPGKCYHQGTVKPLLRVQTSWCKLKFSFILMIKDLRNLVPTELHSQQISKSYAKKLTLGQAIVVLINMHQCLLLIQNGARGGSCVCSGNQPFSLEKERRCILAIKQAQFCY